MWHVGLLHDALEEIVFARHSFMPVCVISLIYFSDEFERCGYGPFEYFLVTTWSSINICIKIYMYMYIYIASSVYVHLSCNYPNANRPFMVPIYTLVRSLPDRITKWLECPSSILGDQRIWTSWSLVKSKQWLKNWYLSLPRQSVSIIRIEQGLVSSVSG